MKTRVNVGCMLFSLALACGLNAEPRRSFYVGVCTHFSQGKGHLSLNLSLIRQAGAVSIRDEAPWRTVEREKGHFSLPPDYDAYVEGAARAGLAPLIILDYGNPYYDAGDKPRSPQARAAFARYAEYLVQRYRDKVKLWEVWNEWDIGIGGTTPGTAEEYVELLREVYPRIKKLAPEITVFGGAMTPSGVQRGWLEAMLRAGGLKYLDQVSIHTYNYSASGKERTPEAWAEWMQKVQELLRRYNDGREVPLAITEMGWPTQIDRRGTPPEVAAAYLARMYLLARTLPFVTGIWWYDFQDDGWDYAYNEHNFGLVRPEGTPKPAWFALRDVAELVTHADFVERVPTPNADIYVLRFRTQEQELETWAIWSAHLDDAYEITMEHPSMQPRPVRVRLVGSGEFQRPWGTRTWTQHKNAPAQPNRLSLVVGRMPWLVTGELAGARIVSLERRPSPELQRPSLVLY